MPVFDSPHQRAAWMIAILGAVIILGLLPYASGLLGAPVLYVVFSKLHVRLSKRLKSRELAAVIVLVIAAISIVAPLVWLVTLLVGQAQDAITSILNSPAMSKMDTMQIGHYNIGPQLKDASSHVMTIIGDSAFTLLGTATRLTLDAVFTFFGLYYLLIDPVGAWKGLRPYIPFSDANVESLHQRFTDVTKSTLIGSGVSALLQGALMCIAFVALGLPDPLFWGAVVAIVSILPVLGSALVWIPAGLDLFLRDHPAKGIIMLVWGAGAGALVDHVFRPYISSRYAHIHPLLILVGAVAGAEYVGILGLLIGPLALSYFFELLRMYQKEYLKRTATA
ncbi:MAG TPA: AI-2E family transporter [Gemmatimonadales bacterium]|jgi:predicted PurR-regulated permease PerM|nr:AI-2E family transporter [Gemmatimonadales bacterium]